MANPFHRGERWARYSTWILVIGFAADGFRFLPKKNVNLPKGENFTERNQVYGYAEQTREFF